MSDVVNQLETINSEGEVPERRFKDASSARSVYDTLRENDKDAAAKRARNQRMFDGEPPYRPGELERAGQKFRTNVNFGEAEDLLQDSLGSYIDMLQSVEVLFNAPTRFGETPEQRKVYGKGVCRAVSNMIRRWPHFFHQYLVNATNFVSQGVSVAVFENDIDWRFKVKGLGDFYVPRDSDAAEDSIEVAFVREYYTVSKLHKAIRNEKAAAKLGWNVDAVKEVLKKSAKGKDDKHTNTQWEDFATRLKTDDLKISVQADEIELLFCFVREFDGTITQYILSAKGQEQEFLFEKKKRYQSMAEAFTLFVYGVGYKGKLYEIRGLGSKIFPAIQVNNRMYCQGIDGAMLASSQMIKPKSASDVGKELLAVRGPYTLLHPGAEIVEQNNPNFAQNTIPVVRQMSDLIRTKAGGYTSSRALPDDSRRMSQYETEARISNAAGMTVTNLILFLEQFEKLLKQIVKRIQRKGFAKELPGGAEVAAMLEELDRLGIPREALYELDVTLLKATRPVGAGSPAARENAFRKLREWSAGFDEEGQRNLTRDGVADILGSYDAADDYVPPATQPRVPDGTKVAMLENYMLEQGKQLPVFSEEFHVAHLDVHTQHMAQYIQATNEGQMPLEEAVPVLLGVHEHSVEHLKYIEADPMKAVDSARYREILQQSGEIIFNGLRRLRSQAEKQAQEAQMEQSEGGGQPQQPGVDSEEVKHTAELRRMEEKHLLNMQILADKAKMEQQRALMKANTEAQIAEAKAVAELSPFSLQRLGR